jgi:hypothetical protein
MTKEVLGSRIDTLAQYLEYVQDGAYKTKVQEDFSRAAELYDLSSDQEELQSISVTLQTYINDIQSLLYIDYLYGDHILDWNSEQNELYITGDDPDGPGEFEVIVENEDAKITCMQEQSEDYWGRIIVEDEEKGIRKVWKVYYTYYDNSIFNISGIEGDGILTFEAESFDGDDRGTLYIYGDADEMPAFTLYPENEEVTWEYTPKKILDMEGYVTMYYEDTEYIYYVYYETIEE